MRAENTLSPPGQKTKGAKINALGIDCNIYAGPAFGRPRVACLLQDDLVVIVVVVIVVVVSRREQEELSVLPGVDAGCDRRRVGLDVEDEAALAEEMRRVGDAARLPDAWADLTAACLAGRVELGDALR